MHRNPCILFLLFCVITLLPGCQGGSASRTGSDQSDTTSAALSSSSPISRADPGQLQFLERQTMLRKSQEMAKVVSGSQLAWRTSASVGSPDEMLGYADTWLSVHPLMLLTSGRRPVFDQLGDSSIWAVLREAGIKGLYVAPASGSGSLWAYSAKGDPTGEDIVQYDFSAQAGKESNYRRLMSTVIDHSALLGSDIVPAATGLGPDFFLASRNIRDFPGIYCMVEVPHELWNQLPATSSEWATVVLSPHQVAALNAKGILPKAMRDEFSPLARRGGWAATGEVRGIDGNLRRWVYRYYGSPGYAVLNWEDPSQAAHRILSGSAVRQVGMLGQALLGLHFEPFQGLEAASKNSSGKFAFSIEPALSAAQSMSREIRRYGGWSWLRDDDLPLTAVNEFMRHGTDYVFDSAFSPAAEHALLTGDTTLARFMADELLRLNVDTRRLVHTTPTQDGINYALPHLSYLAFQSQKGDAEAFKKSILDAMRASVSAQTPLPVQNDILYTTGPGLAAFALKLPPADVPKEQWAAVSKGHSLLIFFKAMQPGALMLSGQDLAGTLPLAWQSMVTSPDNWKVSDTSRGTYALTSMANDIIVSQQGMPKAKQIYPAPDEQVHKEGSFLRSVGSFLRVRSETGISKGTLIARPATKGQGSIALLTQMPGSDSYLLSVCNFSRSPVTEHISLGNIPKISSALSRLTPVTPASQGFSASGTGLSVSLGPWEGKAVFIGGKPGKTAGVSSDAPETTAALPDIPKPSVQPDAAEAAAAEAAKIEAAKAEAAAAEVAKIETAKAEAAAEAARIEAAKAEAVKAEAARIEAAKAEAARAEAAKIEAAKAEAAKAEAAKAEAAAEAARIEAAKAEAVKAEAARIEAAKAEAARAEAAKIEAAKTEAAKAEAAKAEAAAEAARIEAAKAEAARAEAAKIEAAKTEAAKAEAAKAEAAAEAARIEAAKAEAARAEAAKIEAEKAKTAKTGTEATGIELSKEDAASAAARLLPPGSKTPKLATELKPGENPKEPERTTPEERRRFTKPKKLAQGAAAPAGN